MNSTSIITSIIIFLILYPFILHFQLNTFKKKLDSSWKKIETLLEKYNNQSSTELSEEIHIKKRAYNALVRANNHKLKSKIAGLLAKKYHFTTRELFEFKGK